MKSFFKRAAAGLLTLAMCAGLSGCYSEENTWAAKVGGETLPIGSYIYYLSSAYSEGSMKVGTEDDVLNADIEGKKGSEWISQRAMDYLRSYCYVTEKFDELGLTLDETDQESIQNATNSMWPAFKENFERMGIAEESFSKAYSTYNMKLSKLLRTMYGKGGELEVSEDELHEYYTGEYVYYQYFYADLTTTDEEGNSVDMDDDAKAQTKEYMEDQADLVTQGRSTLDRAAANYGNLSGKEPNLGDPVASRLSNLNTVFTDVINTLDTDEAGFIETTTRYYVVQRLDIEEDFKALIADEDRLNSLLSEMKAEEFTDYTIEQGKSLNVEINERAINSAKPSKLADIMGKKGLSSASSEESSSESSSSSSSEEESSSSESSASEG